ncbi:DUF397 domain-containing protein [Streptomyces sp. NPDC045456]|uniref:DUF397 domain-containing protein n=1 Tax=Streptomyces sp. NPDC045456 TaxID=3155254 RepID=UPI0033D465F3
MSRGIGPAAGRWRKSSHSNGGDGNCVEVADAVTGSLRVRDSKDADGPTLIFTHAAWVAFIGELKGRDHRS